MAAVNVTQAATIQATPHETNEAAHEEAAAVDCPGGCGGAGDQVAGRSGGNGIGLGRAGLGRGLGGCAAAAAASSLAFLAAAWRAASARSLGIGDFAERRQHRVPPPWPRRRRPAWRRPAWLPRPGRPQPRPRRGRPPAFLARSSAGPAAWPAGARPWAPRPARSPASAARGSARPLSWRRARPPAGGAPPARAAASFSLSVSGRPSVAGVGISRRRARGFGRLGIGPRILDRSRAGSLLRGRRQIHPRAWPRPLCEPLREFP